LIEIGRPVNMLASVICKRLYSVSRSLQSVVKLGKNMKPSYDVAIVGGGHNGLVSAAYLAKHGLTVGVFEKRHILGGAAVTEEIVPGYKFSRASYVLSLLRPCIIKDLELHKYGLELLERTTSSFTPLLENNLDGKKPKSLLMSCDRQKTCDEIRKFSTADAKAYAEYEDTIEKYASAVQPLLDTQISNRYDGVVDLARGTLPIAKALRHIGSDAPQFYEFMMSPISKVLNRWFNSDPLKATLATDGVIGAMLSPESMGSAYVLLHHMIGQANGTMGSWAFVRGGMGKVSDAIAKCGANFGVEAFVSQDVKKICVNSDCVEGILLEDGRHIKADFVLSNATPYVTFQNLVDKNIVDESEFYKNICSVDYTSPVTKINVAVDTLPNFTAFPNSSRGEVGEQHKGTIHLNCENMDILHNAYVDALNGLPSSTPMIEMCIPSSVDNSLAPSGHHVISLFTQYTPIQLKGNKEWTQEDKEKYAETVFNSVEQYAPGFKDSIVGVDILTPHDLETIFSLTGGNIFHGAMSLDQLAFARPSSVLPSHETPINGLYLCGSGTHPGGGVMGSSGRLAALLVMETLKKNKVGKI